MVIDTSLLRDETMENLDWIDDYHTEWLEFERLCQDQLLADVEHENLMLLPVAVPNDVFESVR